MTEINNDSGTVSPFIALDSPMLSDVLAMLKDLEDLRASGRRDLMSALRKIARLIGKPLEAIPANINWLHIRLRRVHPAAFNMSAKRFANVKSDASKALAITGRSRERADWLREPSPGWAALLDLVPDKRDRWNLTQLAQFCSALGIEPHQVTDQDLLDLHQMIIEESFQADVAAWIDRLENPELLDAKGPSKPLRPSTFAHRRLEIQEIACAPVPNGEPKEEIIDLSVLVDLENLKAALRWTIGRFGGKPMEALQGLAVGLRAIAAHHVQVSEDHLAAIKGIVKRLGRDVGELREKNGQRLLQP